MKEQIISFVMKKFVRNEKRLSADDSLFPQREGISYWDCSLLSYIVKILGSFHIFIIPFALFSVYT